MLLAKLYRRTILCTSCSPDGSSSLILGNLVLLWAPIARLPPVLIPWSSGVLDSHKFPSLDPEESYTALNSIPWSWVILDSHKLLSRCTSSSSSLWSWGILYSYQLWSADSEDTGSVKTQIVICFSLQKFSTAGQLFYIIILKWSGRECDNSFTMVTISVTMMIIYTVLLVHHYKVLSSEKKAKKLQKEK